MNTKNFREITLLKTYYKIFLTSILYRLEKYTNGIIGNYQTDFIRGKLTTDQIFAIKQILEKNITNLETKYAYVL